MSNRSNNQGRAYEYACLHSLEQAIQTIRQAQIIENSSYQSAKRAWDTLSEEEKELYKSLTNI